MDHYSRFIEILSLVETTRQVFIQKLKSVFASWGILEELISDNGTQFKSLQFDEFKAKCGFKDTTPSPHHPQANSAAESCVRIAKRILKQEDPFLALIAYRAAPILETGKTPSELIMGRLIRTTLPTLSKVLEPKLINPVEISRYLENKIGNGSYKRMDLECEFCAKNEFDLQDNRRFWGRSGWFSCVLVKRNTRERRKEVFFLLSRVRSRTSHFLCVRPKILLSVPN